MGDVNCGDEHLFGRFWKRRRIHAGKQSAGFEAFKNEKLLPFQLDSYELSTVIWDVIDDFDEGSGCQLLMAYSTLRTWDIAVYVEAEHSGDEKSVEDIIASALFRAKQEEDEVTTTRCTWILLALMLRTLGQRADLAADASEFLAASWIKISEASVKMKHVICENVLWSDEEKSYCLGEISLGGENAIQSLNIFAPIATIEKTLVFEEFLEAGGLWCVSGHITRPQL